MDQAYQKLGELLLTHQAITEAQLATALTLQAQSNRRLGEILISQGFVDEDRIASCLAHQYGYSLVDPAEVLPTPEALAAIPSEVATKHRILPVTMTPTELFCVVADPLNLPITDELAVKYHRHIRVAVASESKLVVAIQRHYRVGSSEQFDVTMYLPPRYVQPFPRGEYGDIICVSAIDSYLERPVTLFRVAVDASAKESHFDLLKRTAKTPDPDFFGVYDSFVVERYRWTVVEELKGEQLAATLRFRGRRSPTEAADIVRMVAEAAEKLPPGRSKWICPENIWIDKGNLRIAPYIPAQKSYQTESEVEGLGALLWHCLMGSFTGEFDFDLATARTIPAGMVMILQRCLATREADRFATVAEVGRALGSYRWSVTESEVPTPSSSLDREELLATLRVVTPGRKASIWRRLFGWKAA